MNKFDTIRKVCKPVRMTVGVALVATALITGNPWFFLGVIPFLAGATGFCPLCTITKKCSI